MHIKPKVSIIVPIHNKAAYLNECLDSIRSQSLDEIEIICIDDGSTDRSIGILERHSKQDSRMRIFRHTKNLGIIQARKSGMEMVRGEYAAFIDADDLAHHDMCAELYEAAIKKNADFVQCNAQIYDPEKILSEDLLRHYNNGISYGKHCTFSGNEIFKRYTTPIRNVLFIGLYRNDLCKKVVKYIDEEAPKRGDDDLLTFFFCYFAQKYYQIENILYHYRASGTSSNLNKITREIAESQVKGRAAALKYAKLFALKNGLTWNRDERPFAAFTNGIVRYAGSFIDRYIDDGGSEQHDLMRLFGDCFGGDAVMYLIRKKDGYDRIAGDHYHLIEELNSVYSSRSWKMTAPLRWIIRKLRGY